MMLELFKHKEKNSIVILVLYLFTLVSYTLALTALEYNDDDAIAFYFFILMNFMVEAFKYSLFNLSYYFANGSDYSITKPVVSRLRTHLHFLSIKMNDFVLYNVVYTVLRLLPFLIITGILAKGPFPIYFVVVFSAVYILKAIVGPMVSYVQSMQMDVYLNNKELSRKEKQETFEEMVKENYPNANMNVFKTLKSLYMFSYIILTMGVYTIVFRFVLEFFNWNVTLVYSVLGISFINILVYGLYLNNLERKQDHVLYQE